MRIAPLASLLALALCAGCAGIGARTVTADRFDYTTALSDSWKREMLINIVKVRYGDAPVFLDVSSVIESYELVQSVSVGGLWQNNSVSTTGATLGASGAFANRPTISYSPISGEKFAKAFMTPIQPQVVFGLIQSGYPADTVFRVLVQSVNGVSNRRSSQAMPQPASAEFAQLAQALRELQTSGTMDLRVTKTEKAESHLVVLRAELDAPQAAQSKRLRKMLGLDPDANEFSLVYGRLPANERQIALVTRSMMQVLIDYGSFIDVPAIDVTEQRVVPSVAEQPVQGLPYIRIHSGPAKPQDAFVAVPYRNHWFWIDDRDWASKELFSFLLSMFTLVNVGDRQAAPVISLPLR
jgi:hypothetical protein